MGYLKYMAYIYLVIAVLFAVDGIVKLNDGEDAVISFLFAGVGIFMFFFKKNSYKKFQDRNPNK